MDIVEEAKRLGVFNKIDLFMEDDEKEEWEMALVMLDNIFKVLNKLSVLYGRINTNKFKLLEKLPAKHYFNVKSLKQSLQAEFCKEFNNDKLLSELMSTLSYVEETVMDFTAIQSAPRILRKVSAEMMIVDVDYEFRETHAVIVVYGRDTNNLDKTYTVTYKFDDYFYFDRDTVPDNVLDYYESKFIKSIKWASRNTTENDNTGSVNFKDKSNISSEANIVSKTEQVTNLFNCYGYEEKSRNLTKVYAKFPNFGTYIYNNIEGDIKRNSLETSKYEFFENRVDYITKFFAEFDIGGFDVIQVDGLEERNTMSTSHVFIKANTLKKAPVQNHYDPTVAYFDIECLSIDGKFPDASTSPIIQCSFIVMRGDEEMYKNVLCVEDTPGYESYTDESQLLFRLNQLILQYDPDILCGFNSNMFDIPYIVKRAQVLGIYDDVCNWSRRKKTRIWCKEVKSSSNQFGAKTSYQINCIGRTAFDFMPYAIENLKLRDYSLRGVAEFAFEKDKELQKKLTKLDMTAEVYPEIGYDPNNPEDKDKYDNYSLMKPLFTFPRGRAKIAEYCLRDSELLVEINKKLLLVIVVMQMTKVLGCSMDTTLNRGKTYKITRKMVEYTKREKFVLPTFNSLQRPKMPDTYDGAIVLDPHSGYYTDCTSVLDFKSLYPSIIRAWNLSLDTIVTERSTGLGEDDIESISTGDKFVKSSKRKGILAMIEEELMEARDFAKGQKKKYPDGSLLSNVFDGKQLAIKVICNSIYGYTGARTSPTPLVNIAASICKIGREQILLVKEFVEQNFKRITNGEVSGGVEVVYGDTDSVFVRMVGLHDIEKCIKYSKLLEHEINTKIYSQRNPMEIEYEKIFSPFLLLKKKKYIARKWTYSPDPKKSSLNYSGVEIARRDGSLICIDMMSFFVKTYFEENNLEAALLGVEERIQKLFNNEYDFDMYKIGKKLKRDPHEYKTKQRHIELWKQIRKSVGVKSAPQTGQYLYYIACKGDNKGKVQFTWFPHAKRKQFNPDADFYFNDTVVKPLKRILEYIISPRTLEMLLDKSRYDTHVEVQRNDGKITNYFSSGTSSFKKTVKKRKAPLHIELRSQNTTANKNLKHYFAK